METAERILCFLLFLGVMGFFQSAFAGAESDGTNEVFIIDENGDVDPDDDGNDESWDAIEDAVNWIENNFSGTADRGGDWVVEIRDTDGSAPDTYDETIQMSSISADASHQIAIRPETGTKITVDSNGNSDVFEILGVPYVTIENLILVGGLSYDGVEFSSGSDNGTVTSCYFTGLTTGVDLGEDGGSDNITIQGNRFTALGWNAIVLWDGGSDGGDDDVVIRNNTIHAIQDDRNSDFANHNGIWMQDGSYATIKNNIIWAEGADGDGDPTFGIIATSSADTANITSDYNTIYRTSDAEGEAQAGSWEGTSAKTLADWQSTSGQDGNSIAQKPRFVDPSNATFTARDFHLKSEYGYRKNDGNWYRTSSTTSPCIDAADPGDAFTNEREDNGDRLNQGAYGNTEETAKSGSLSSNYWTGDVGNKWHEHGNWSHGTPKGGSSNLFNDLIVDPTDAGSNLNPDPARSTVNLNSDGSASSLEIESGGTVNVQADVTLTMGYQDGTVQNRVMTVHNGGKLQLAGDSSGRAELHTPTESDPGNRDRIDLTVHGTFHADTARMTWLTSSGIKFMDESTLERLYDVVFDYGTDGGSEGQYLNFDADSDSTGSAGYNIKTSVSDTALTPVYRKVEFRNSAGDLGLDNVDADDGETADAVTFQTAGGSDLSTNAIKFAPIYGEIGGAEHEEDDGTAEGGRVLWGGGYVENETAGTTHNSLQKAIESASSGDVLSEAGNRIYREDLDLGAGPGNLLLKGFVVKGDLDNTSGSDSSTIRNVTVVQDGTDGDTEAIGNTNPIDDVQNCLIVDGSISGNTVKNCVTVDTDGSGGHAISASTATANQTNLIDTSENDLAAYWTLNDGPYSTVARDDSGNGNSADLINMDTANDWVSGTGNINFRNANALDFDGNDDYLEVTNPPDIGDTGTLTFWIKPESDSKEQLPFHHRDSTGSDDRLYVWFESEGTVDFGLGGSSKANIDNIFNYATTDGWTFYALRWDSGNWKAWKDGTTATGTYSGSVKTNNVAWNIGRRRINETNYLDGPMDDLRVYDRALSDSEVQVIANGNRPSRRLFANVDRNDFHLRVQEGLAASAHPLIDAGTDLSGTFTNDYDGNTRGIDGDNADGDDDVTTGNEWDIGPDEYSPYTDEVRDLEEPEVGTTWTWAGPLVKNGRGPAQCVYVPYSTGSSPATGHLKVYSVDVDGDFGGVMGHLDGGADANEAINRFVRVYVERRWFSSWSDPGYRVFAVVDTNEDGDGDKLYGMRHVDTTADGTRNLDTLRQDPDWGGTKKFASDGAGSFRSLSNVNARRVSMTLNGKYIYVVDGDNAGNNGAIYRRKAVDGTDPDGDPTDGGNRNADHDWDDRFYHLPQSWQGFVLVGIRGQQKQVRRLSADLSSIADMASLGTGTTRLNERLNFSNLNAGRMVYGAPDDHRIYKIQSDQFGNSVGWGGDNRSFDVGTSTRHAPSIFPGMDFIWGVGKDRVYKVARSDGSSPGDWGGDWPMDFSGRTLVTTYSYWPFKDLMYVATQSGSAYFLNAVLGDDASGDTASSTGEADGTVVTGWPYRMPGKKILDMKMAWDGDWNIHVFFLYREKNTGNYGFLAFPLP